MKKKISLILGLVVMLMLFAACGDKAPVYHTVSFNSNGAEEFQSRAIAHNESVIEPQVPTRVGYSFLGWYKGEQKWNFETDKVTESFTLSAKWKRITFNVKFDSNGGSAVEEQVVESGNFAVKPADPTKQDSRFIGWYRGNDEWFFNINRVTDYITLVAKWEDYPTYTVEFNSDGGTSVPYQYVIEGHKANEPTPPTKENFKFLGWYDGEALWNFNANTINRNTVLTAKWEAMPTFTVTFNSNGGAPVDAQHIIDGGKAIKPPTPEREQRSNFIGWYLGDTEWNFDTVITSNITLVAKWQNVYKITFSTEGLYPDSTVYAEEGELLNKQPEPSKQNSRFIGWYLGEKKWNFDSDMPTSDITLTAKWEPIPTYTVTFDSTGGSGINPQYVLENSYITAPGNPIKSGYRFDGWFANGELWDFNTKKVTSHVTLTAKWVKIVTVVFYSDGGTFINPSTIDMGTAVTAPQAPTKAGYVFRGWTLPDGTTWDFNTAVTEDLNLTAKWLVARTVTFYHEEDGEFFQVTVGDGELLPRPEAPDKGEKFLLGGWFIAGTDTYWDFSKMTVTEDVTLIADWILVLPFAPTN